MRRTTLFFICPCAVLAAFFLFGCTTTELQTPSEPEPEVTLEPLEEDLEETMKPEITPPPVETLTLLPAPQQVRYEPGRYAPDRLEPEIELRPPAIPREQGYILSITPERILITARDLQGIFYAEQTLNQLKRQFAGTGKLPVVYIEDWPDFPNRGVMLDVARDKVPTMDTLYLLVDMLASLKFNQLQLYTEHTFAYPGHEEVWKDASPMTAEEIQALDAYCAKRFIELVPNQNSFGHMHRWLEHDRYKGLAETPGSPDLCPTNPASIDLLRSMYDGMLPNFTSRQFNVGCDETFSLGKGGSREEVARFGKGRVYLDFLKKIYTLVRQHDCVMQFWGDIILEYPELIPELPENIIAMEWGYEANHPFAKRGAKFAASGVPFYVCPGTSSWNALLGRTDNALENLRLAARNGLDNGAIGYLITDWGDNGHWQFAPVSFAPFAYGAAVSWACAASENMDLARAVDAHVFMDKAGVMTQAALDLGKAHALTGCLRGNSTVYYGLLLNEREGDPAGGRLKGLTLEGIQQARVRLEEALARMNGADMDRPDAQLILDEFALNTEMALFALQLGEARLKAGTGTSDLPQSVRQPLAATLNGIMERYQSLWLARNRPGGLSDSVERLASLAAVLSQ